ncbi:MAG: group II intron reverse transcriptase/maturase [Lachnospiraceae bacterium]|nr:group II intron reverse transcriptase/maturase [Lachnospiraceae bacterium]
METKLGRIADKSAREARPIFTSLYHLLNEEVLLKCHRELSGNKAVGIDEVTKEEYSRNLEENIQRLVTKLKHKAYKPQPVKRVYIPKANGSKRPLGIAAYEDKIVQLGLKKILEAVYEPKFQNEMYGFRPRRNCHMAIKSMCGSIIRKRIDYVVDADIKGFFDHMNHEWVLKFVGYYIKDPNILNLINKFLKAGILDEGRYETNSEGSVQGGNISPILANIYMHHVLVLWYKAYFEKRGRGNSFLVVYADDFIAGFEYKSEAERYYRELQERLRKYGLEIEMSKSRLLEFGRYARERRKRRGEGRPETFDFLGFTFYCGETLEGKFCVIPRTNSKRFRKSLKEMNLWLKYNRNIPLKELMSRLNQKLVGHYRYYGVSYNVQMLVKYHYYVVNMLFKWLNRRSQKKSFTWEQFHMMLTYYPIAKPKRYVNLYG